MVAFLFPVDVVDFHNYRVVLFESPTQKGNQTTAMAMHLKTPSTKRWERTCYKSQAQQVDRHCCFSEVMAQFALPPAWYNLSSPHLASVCTRGAWAAKSKTLCKGANTRNNALQANSVSKTRNERATFDPTITLTSVKASLPRQLVTHLAESSTGV